MEQKLFVKYQGEYRLAYYRPSDGSYNVLVGSRFIRVSDLTDQQKRYLASKAPRSLTCKIKVGGRLVDAYWDSLNEYVVISTVPGVFYPYYEANDRQIARCKKLIGGG